jgi:hypothetical protein
MPTGKDLLDMAKKLRVRSGYRTGDFFKGNCSK